MTGFNSKRMMAREAETLNERIRQLWSQAEEEIKAEYEDESRRNRRLYNEIFLPKFAELIVKECLFQVDKIRDGLEADGENQQALGADWAGLAVARHFGVEE